jgi:hypothetical protein
MTTAVLKPRTHQFDVEDIEYVRHGDKPLLARVFQPRGKGPFPALVECHGGAWCVSDRTTERLRHEAMAKNGIVSIAIKAKLRRVAEMTQMTQKATFVPSSRAVMALRAAKTEGAREW